MEDVMPFVVGSLVIIMVILLSIRLQVSTMEGLDDLTVENNQRLGYKAVGSYQMLDQGERYGVLTEDQYEDIKRNCGESLSGFQGNPLTLEDANCEEVVMPLPTPLQLVNYEEVVVEESGENGGEELTEEEVTITNRHLKVGETREGIN